MAPQKKNRYHLLRLAQHAKSLQEITDLAYQILGNPMFIEDRSSVKLAYTKNPPIKDPDWLKGVVNTEGYIPKQSEVREMLVGYQMSEEQDLPIILSDSSLDHTPKIIKTIFSGSSHVGTIVVPGYYKEITEQDIDLVEILSGYIWSFLVDERYPLANNANSLQNLFYQLLRGDKFNPDLIHKIIEKQGWNENTVHYVFDFFPTKRIDNEETRGEIAELFNHIPNTQHLYFNNHMVSIFHTDEPHACIDELELPFTDILEEYDLIAGVSQPFSDLNDLEERYRQAMAMGGLGSILNTDIFYYAYDKFACYHMMEITSWTTPLKQFCHHKILELEQYDLQHNTDLTRTLHIYLESSRSISHTASVMFMHKNTVTYRINKCFDLLGTKIEDNNELYSFLFSLRLLEYTRKKAGDDVGFPPKKKDRNYGRRSTDIK